MKMKIHPHSKVEGAQELGFLQVIFENPSCGCLQPMVYYVYEFSMGNL